MGTRAGRSVGVMGTRAREVSRGDGDQGEGGQ